MTRWILVLPLALGCKPIVEADRDLDVALRDAFLSMDQDDAEAALALRALERAVYRTMPVGAADVAQRGVAPKALGRDDVLGVEPRPDDDPAEAVPPVAVGYLSPYAVDEHAPIQLIADPAHEGLEPSSPDHYDRTFLEGEDCWVERDCAWLRTVQDLTKEYGGLLKPIPYTMFKDFRWVDLSLGTDAEAPRWGYVARSWTGEPFSSDNGQNTIWQSYTVEIWLPRDGGGFLWADEEEAPGSADMVDSEGPGTLRLMSLWTETELAIQTGEDIEIGTIRWGMDQVFQHHDAWLDEHVE